MPRRKSFRNDNLRRAVAQEAARVMAEHGIQDFRAAKRKAAERFGVTEEGALPSNAEVEESLVAYQRLFGHPGLHVADGSTLTANLGVNPSLTITAQAERAMSFWPNKGEVDTRPPLGTGYQRIEPVLPKNPMVPDSAPAALRFGPVSLGMPDVRSA